MIPTFPFHRPKSCFNKIKLTYSDTLGSRGEAIRLASFMTQVPFVDDRVSFFGRIRHPQVFTSVPQYPGAGRRFAVHLALRLSGQDVPGQ